MLPLPLVSPASLAAFLLAVAFLGALCTLSAVFSVARLRPHLLPDSLRFHLIAERRILERARRMALHKAERADRMQAALLNNVSHEIRTPLTGILAAAQILREEVDTEQRELTEMIIRDSQRMHVTLSNVLDLVELEATARPPEPEPIDLAQVVREAVQPYEAFAERKGLALKVPGADEALQTIGDPVLLRKVVGNLVENAIKFTDAGEVIVAVHDGAEGVAVMVEDTGPGIAKPLQPLLFSPFLQGSQGLSRAHAGTGLGLTLTKRLVDLMGGQITVSSRPGAGSLFTVALPRHPMPGDAAMENL